jgi:predicted GIY-YIG superfamily endonuclease
MQNNSKIYNFYVLTSEDDPENIRYVGVTTKKVTERFSQHKYCALHKEKRGLPVHKWMFSKYEKGGKILVK